MLKHHVWKSSLGQISANLTAISKDRPSLAGMLIRETVYDGLFQGFLFMPGCTRSRSRRSGRLRGLGRTRLFLLGGRLILRGTHIHKVDNLQIDILISTAHVDGHGSRSSIQHILRHRKPIPGIDV